MVYTKLVLETRRVKEHGIYPIKLRVTFNRIQKYYVTGYHISETDFGEVTRPVAPKRLQELKIQLDHLELKARNIISTMGAFNFMAFEERFYENKKAGKGIFELYNEVVTEKYALGKVSTAVNYQCSMRSLQLFAPWLSYVDVTPKFLKGYERHLLQEGKSISTVGIYLRPLRAILNEAINQKFLSKDNYPFGPKKYVIPESRNIKKAISRDDLKKIIQYLPEHPAGFGARSRDFWLLSYFCQGMNLKDLLLLKTANIEQGFIRFIREKTKETVRRNIMEITVPLLPQAQQIIERWRSRDDEGSYLFPFITEEMTPLQVYKTVQQFVKVTNKHMGAIAQQLGIEKKITSYVARFQFTKAMMDANVSVEYIRQCLGHQNYSTTKRYIGSFELEQKHDIAKGALLNFE